MLSVYDDNERIFDAAMRGRLRLSPEKDAAVEIDRQPAGGDATAGRRCRRRLRVR